MYYETTQITNEIEDYNIENKIIYLEKLLNFEFIIQDNLPHEALDITLSFKNWLVKKVSQLKVKQIQNISKTNFNDLVEIDLKGLNFDKVITDTLSSRIEEINKGILAKSPLSVIFLSGSTLEGILLGKAKKLARLFNETKCSPKQNGKVKPLIKWSLNDLINSSFEIGLIDQDVKKFNHHMRDFRNYIHPFEQIKEGFNPTMDTAIICQKVLQVTVKQIKENFNKIKRVST